MPYYYQLTMLAGGKSAYMKIGNGIYSVGVINPALRVFDIIMQTEFGTSYNAYVVKGEKTALIETCHEKFAEDYFANLEQACDVASVDYLVMNHTEPDHSGCVAKLLERNPKIVVYGTAATIKNIGAISGRSFNSQVVKHGEILDLGGKTLQFFVAPNLHWPDSMFTYCPEECTLFTCDFLGAHFCEPRLYCDQTTCKAGYDRAFAYYYAAIFGPFKPFVLAGLEKIQDLCLKMVCPSHGPVLRGDSIIEAVDNYRKWSTPKPTELNVAIFYVSAYGFTEEMAKYLEKGLSDRGIPAKSYNIIEHDYAFQIEKLEGASAVLFGSPTINRDALKPVWDLLSMVDAVNNKGKTAGVFGCYGWSGEACAQLESRLEGLKLKMVHPAVKSLFKPTEQVFSQLDTMADAVVDALK